MAFGIEALTATVKAESKLIRSSLRVGVEVAMAQAADQLAATKEQTEVQKRIEQLLIVANEQRQKLVDLASPPPCPPNPVGPFTSRLIQEIDAMLFYKFKLPQLPAAPADNPTANDDVVNGGRGEMRLAFDGVAQSPIATVVTVEGTDEVVESDEVGIAKGVAVTGEFTFIDDDGNDSKESVPLEGFTTADTLDPQSPTGAFAARLVRETAD